MRNDPGRRRRGLFLLWIAPLLILGLPCNVCNMLQSAVSAVYPTYTPFPTYTPLSAATQPMTATLMAPTETITPPAQTPTPAATFTPSATATPAPPPTKTPIPHSDIAVTKIAVDSQGIVYLNAVNYGPARFVGSVVVVCQGVAWVRGNPQSPFGVSWSKSFSYNMGVGPTYGVPTTLHINPAYTYQPLVCTIVVPDGIDPNPHNNAGVLSIP